MDSRDLAAPRGLSREARADPGGGRDSRASGALPAAALPAWNRGELLQIMTAQVIPSREWKRAVFHGDEAYASIEALQAALAKRGQGLPAHVYGSRSLRSQLNAAALMAVVFPDGVPPAERMTLELQTALKNFNAAARAIYECPGMETLEIDRGVVIVCNEDVFIKMTEECISKSGQEL